VQERQRAQARAQDLDAQIAGCNQLCITRNQEHGLKPLA
jgi:hypothetical protein